MQCRELFPTHAPSYEESSRDNYHEGLCNYCDQQVLGNEVHILLHCPILKDGRDAILKHISDALDTFSQPPMSALTDAQKMSVLCGETPKSPTVETSRKMASPALHTPPYHFQRHGT
jgi:hypothetical protein